MSDSESELVEVIGKLSVDNTKSAKYQPFSRKMNPNTPSVSPVPPAGNSSVASILPPLSKEDFQLYCSLLPEFISESEFHNDLSKFIRKVDKVYNQIKGRLSIVQAAAIEEIIDSKIKGEASNYIGYLNCTGWIDIKNALMLKYGDQRSEGILDNELRMCTQYPNESYKDFYYKVLRSFNDLMKHLSLKQLNEGIFQMKRVHYQEIAINTFKSGLLEPYRSYIKRFDIISIEEGLQKCLTHDNEKSQDDYHDYIRAQFKSKTTQHQAPKFNSESRSTKINQSQSLFYQTPPTWEKNFVHTFPNYSRNPQSTVPLPRTRPGQSSSQSQPKPFSRNVNKPLIHPPKFKPPTNKQNFGVPPGPTYSDRPQLPNPTPMSVQSRVNTDRYNNRFNYQNYQNNNPPRYVFEELFNSEEQDPLEIQETERTGDEFSEYAPEYEQLEEESENFHPNASQQPKT